MKKNQLLNAVTIVAIACITLSCVNKGTNNKGTKKSEVKSTISAAIDVDSLLSQASSFIGKKVTIEGICTHICKHGGRKIFLMGEGQSLRIEGGEVGKFEQKCVNSIVTVTGILIEDRIDETYLLKWEAKIAEQVKEEHGDGEAGCSAEQKARQEKGNTPTERIANFRSKIAQNKVDTGKEYLSFYHISALSYEVQ